MGKKNSNSLREMARSLGVEDGEYNHFREAVLMYLDHKTGSRDETAALNPKSTARHLEAFVETSTAKNYDRFYQDLNSANGQKYENAMPIFKRLVEAWIRNLKKKTKPSRKTTTTAQASDSRPTMIDLEDDEGLVQPLQADLGRTSANTCRSVNDSSNALSGSARDETLRPDTPDFEFTTDLDTNHLDTSLDQPGIDVSDLSCQLHPEVDNASSAGPSNSKRKRDEIASSERIIQEHEDETADETEDDEDEQYRQELARARAGKRVRRDEAETSPTPHLGTAARASVPPNTPGTGRTLNTSVEVQSPPLPSISEADTATLPVLQVERPATSSPTHDRNNLLLPNLPSPTTSEMTLWPDIFYRLIRDKQLFLAQYAEKHDLAEEDIKIFEAVSNSLEDLYDRVHRIAEAFSWRPS